MYEQAKTEIEDVVRKRINEGIVLCRNSWGISLSRGIFIHEEDDTVCLMGCYLIDKKSNFFVKESAISHLLDTNRDWICGVIQGWDNWVSSGYGEKYLDGYEFGQSMAKKYLDKES